MLSGGLVGQLRELADQFLEREPHLGVADDIRVQLDPRELLGHLLEQIGLGEPVDLGGEAEPLKDVAGVRRERLDVGKQVVPDVIRVAD